MGRALGIGSVVTNEPRDDSVEHESALPTHQRPYKLRLHQVAFATALILAGATTLFHLVTSVASYHWIPDILTSFASYVAAMALIGCLCSFASRSRVLMTVAVAVTVGSFSTALPEFGFGAHVTPRGVPVKVLSANLLSSNRDVAKLIETVQSERPDIVVLLEANEFWTSATADFDEDYPFVIARPRADNFGIIVRSRFPLANVSVVTLASSRVPTVLADVVINGSSRNASRSFRLIATHPVPPVGRSNWHDRNTQLSELAGIISQHAGPLLLVGDLNATPWSPFFKSLKSDAKLNDCRQAGYGFGTTWNAKSPLLSIPIDHALTTLPVVDYHIGAPIGSDHRPIVATVDVR